MDSGLKQKEEGASAKGSSSSLAGFVAEAAKIEEARIEFRGQ
jgi:hypothetical protein